MRTFFKPFLLILSIAVIAGAGFCTAWTVINWGKVPDAMHGEAVYTHKDIENARQDGYKAGITSQEKWEALIESHKARIDELTTTIADLNTDSEILAAQIEQLEAQGDVDAATLAELRANLLANQDTIYNLELELAQKVDELAVMEPLLDGGELPDRLGLGLITMTDDVCCEMIIFAEPGVPVILPTPPLTLTSKQRFKWKDFYSGEVIPGNTITIYEPTALEAVVINLYEVNFVYNGEVLSAQLVEEGELPVEPEFTAPEGYSLLYWTGGDSEGIAPATQDVTYTAVVGETQVEYYNVNFMVGDNVINTQSVEAGSAPTAIAPPQCPWGNAAFVYWQDGSTNQEVDISNYPISGDTNFIATFYGLVAFATDEKYHWENGVVNITGNIWTKAISWGFSSEDYWSNSQKLEFANMLGIDYEITLNTGETISYVERFACEEGQKSFSGDHNSTLYINITDYADFNTTGSCRISVQFYLPILATEAILSAKINKLYLENYYYLYFTVDPVQIADGGLRE